jgi:hypothetical protein
MAKQPDTKGFDKDQIDYLTSHAQQFHSPDDFSTEVSRHLNEALRAKDPKDGWDAPTPQDDFDQQANDEAQKIQNLASHENPVNPAPKSTSPSKTPDWTQLGK